MDEDRSFGPDRRRNDWSNSRKAPAFVRSLDTPASASPNPMKDTHKTVLMHDGTDARLAEPVSDGYVGKSSAASTSRHSTERDADSFSDQDPRNNFARGEYDEYNRRDTHHPQRRQNFRDDCREERARPRSPHQRPDFPGNRSQNHHRGGNERFVDRRHQNWRPDRQNGRERTDRDDRPQREYRDRRNRHEMFEKNIAARQEDFDKLPTYLNPHAVNVPKVLEQEAKRKLLWSKPAKSEDQPATDKSAMVWQGVAFAGDKDGTVANKFKKLMGVRDADATTSAESSSTIPDILTKQDQLLRDLDRQYHAARLATHTQRGVGLGFNS